MICDVIVDHRPQMGGCSHVDAMRSAEEEFEPTETSRDEADEACPETMIKGIGARFVGILVAWGDVMSCCLECHVRLGL